ncbi:unnamed protein product [Larinioides sclopetarius]|uniref:Uncharacterized protein n=1 Tax=Larinioides sclopetarius TaxID=280406 RepID=A0AAV2BX79_9ARAC
MAIADVGSDHMALELPEIRALFSESGILISQLYSEQDIQNYPEIHSRSSYSRKVFILVMEILLSLVPLSAFCMGALHCGTCPANEVVPHLVYMTGIAGLFLSGLHISYQFTIDQKKELRDGIKTFQIITAKLLIIEMGLFFTMSPSFENSENYCDETFYNYTFYTNIAAAGIVFLSVLLQYTSCKNLLHSEAF